MIFGSIRAYGIYNAIKKRLGPLVSRSDAIQTIQVLLDKGWIDFDKITGGEE